MIAKFSTPLPEEMRQHPIPPVTEPMQYRAIGLVNAVYVPQDENTLTRGVLRCEDGTEIEAVLLGRVLSVVKRHWTWRLAPVDCLSA